MLNLDFSTILMFFFFLQISYSQLSRPRDGSHSNASRVCIILCELKLVFGLIKGKVLFEQSVSFIKP